jgi:uncharacterized protein YdhG (YjbR/CyaY superfamily)
VKPKTIDDYLKRLSAEQRAALEGLRRTIRRIVPRAEECISYQLPAFRLDGKVIAWFGAAKSHCSFYPGGIDPAFAADLKGFDTSKGTVRFQPEHPLPASLVRKLIRARIAKTAKPAETAKPAKPKKPAKTAKIVKRATPGKTGRRTAKKPPR